MRNIPTKHAPETDFTVRDRQKRHTHINPKKGELEAWIWGDADEKPTTTHHGPVLTQRRLEVSIPLPGATAIEKLSKQAPFISIYKGSHNKHTQAHTLRTHSQDQIFQSICLMAIRTLCKSCVKPVMQYSAELQWIAHLDNMTHDNISDDDYCSSI